MIGLKTDMVKLEPYNYEWKKEFELEKERLLSILSGFEVDVQHVGSTSIEGCPAKPVIDIFIGIESLEYGEQLVPILVTNGYIYEGDGGRSGEHYFKKRGNNVTTHHIHMAPNFGQIWKNQILFRDYLKTHPEIMQEYINLKTRLSIQFPDNRESYSAGKKDFIENIIYNAERDFRRKKLRRNKNNE